MSYSGGLQLSVWSLGSHPWKRTTKDISSGEWGRRKSFRERWKGLGVSGALRPPPLRVYFGNGQETCFLPEVAFFQA